MGLIKTFIEEWKYRFGAPKNDDTKEGARKVGTATIQSNTVGGWYDGLSEQDWKDIGFEKLPAVPGMMERYCEPDLCVVCGKSGVMERGKHGADWYHKECYPKLVAPPYQNAQEAWAERVQINANKQWICAARCDCGAIPGSWKRAQVCRDKGYCGCVPATDHNLIDVKCKDCSRVLYRIQDRPDLKDIGFEKMPAVPRTKPASGNSDFNLSSVWLRQHRHEYAGQWVALIGASWIDSHKERAVLQERIKDRPDIKDILVVYCEPKMPWEATTDGRVCLRCGKVNPAPQEDCTAGEEVPDGGMEPHIFDPKFKPYDFAAQDRNKQRAHRGRCATGGYCPHPTHKKDDKQYYDGSDQNQIVPGSPEWRERYERFGCDESWWFCTNKFCRCNPDEQAPPDDFYCGCVRLTDDLKPERCRTCFSLMVHRDCVVERGSSRMCEYGTRGCVVVHKNEHLRWGVYGIVEQKFVGCSDQCDGSFEDADGTARYLNEKYGHNDHNYEARVMPVGTVKILPEIDVGVLQARVSELEKINAYAAEQLLSR